MDPTSFKCPVCQEFDSQNLDSLRIHCSKRHKLAARALYVSLFLNGIEPKCACGCGETPKFWTLQRGFAEYIRGHIARVHNNWGHNESAKKKSQDVRRKQIADGDWTPWNKGEIADSDSRVAANNDAIRDSILSRPEERTRRARRMSNQWKIGSIVPLRGKDHPQWKGGASALQPIVRSRLHAVWVYPKLHLANFKCQQCGKPGPGLEVHHDKERFAEILQKAISVYGQIDETAPDDDFKKKSGIADWVASYHVENNVSGIVLCEKCHDEIHSVCV